MPVGKAVKRVGRPIFHSGGGEKGGQGGGEMQGHKRSIVILQYRIWEVNLPKKEREERGGGFSIRNVMNEIKTGAGYTKAKGAKPGKV